MSKFLSLNQQDFLKGLLVAVFAAVISFLYQLLSQGGDVFNLVTLQQMGNVALLAALGYLSKNLQTNSEGQPFQGEN